MTNIEEVIGKWILPYEDCQEGLRLALNGAEEFLRQYFRMSRERHEIDCSVSTSEKPPLSFWVCNLNASVIDLLGSISHCSDEYPCLIIKNLPPKGIYADWTIEDMLVKLDYDVWKSGVYDNHLVPLMERAVKHLKKLQTVSSEAL